MVKKKRMESNFDQTKNNLKMCFQDSRHVTRISFESSGLKYEPSASVIEIIPKESQDPGVGLLDTDLLLSIFVKK